jgi:hypothetical protein
MLSFSVMQGGMLLASICVSENGGMAVYAFPAGLGGEEWLVSTDRLAYRGCYGNQQLRATYINTCVCVVTYTGLVQLNVLFDRVIHSSTVSLEQI